MALPTSWLEEGRVGTALNSNISSTLPLQALSGRTGRLLWSAGSAGLVPPSGSKRLTGMIIEGIDARAGDPHGLPDVLVIYHVGFEDSVDHGRRV